MASTMAILAMVEYCLFMNASAPTLIASATSLILGVPSSCERTLRARRPATISAMILITMTTIMQFQSFPDLPVMLWNPGKQTATWL